MYCPKCGSEVNTGNSFCPNCGTKITTDNQSATKISLDNNPIFNTLATILKNKEIGIAAAVLVLISFFLPFISIKLFDYNMEFSLFDSFSRLRELERYFSNYDVYAFLNIVIRALALISIVSLVFAIMKVKPALLIIGILQLIIIIYFTNSVGESIASSVINNGIGYYLYLIGSILLMLNGLTAFYNQSINYEKVYIILAVISLIIALVLRFLFAMTRGSSPSAYLLVYILLGIGVILKNKQMIMIVSILNIIFKLFDFNGYSIFLTAVLGIVCAVLFAMIILFAIKKNSIAIKKITIAYIIAIIFLIMIIYGYIGNMSYMFIIESVGFVSVALWCKESIEQKTS